MRPGGRHLLGGQAAPAVWVTELTPGSAASFTWPTGRQGGGGTQVMPSQPEPQARSAKGARATQAWPRAPAEPAS